MRILTATVALLAMSTSTFAATFTYNFDGTTTSYSASKSFTSPGGPNLSVTANTINGSTVTPVTGSGRGVGQWSGLGLGLKNSSGDNSHTVDGLGLNDLLLLTFDEPVQIISASFSYAGKIDNSTDGFDFYASGTNLLSHQDIGANASGFGIYDFLADSVDDPYSLVFSFGASWDQVVSIPYWSNYCHCTKYKQIHRFDSYKLRSVTVNYGPGQTVVPLPAALPLLASGLGGLGLISWRRSRKRKVA